MQKLKTVVLGLAVLGCKNFCSLVRFSGLWMDDLMFCEVPSKRFVYGTSGFRDKADLLGPIIVRVGLVTALRCVKVSMDWGTRRTCGILVTASHNPVSDNGLKIVDHTGAMLPLDWETACTDLVNSERKSDLASSIAKLLPNL